MLAEDIYIEKYIAVPTSYTEAEITEFVDLAYETMLARENYIAELISSNSGVETTTTAWEYNLNYLKAHYNELMAQEDINGEYVDLYIEDYEIVLATGDMPEARINGVRTLASSYNASDAVAYAQKYFYPYNSEYPDWRPYGGDCANFVSQCLYAGGKSMKGTPGSSSSAQDWSNWFSSGNSCNTSNVSSTWRGANAFKSYWQVNSSSYATFSYVGEESYDYGFTVDAVSLLNENGSAYHTLIIVGYDPVNHDFIMGAHSDSTITKKLSEYPTYYGFIIYNMR
ncbi:MAG: amidase domain-containing protein [Acetatifactor sp.]|nr:amidase domain-containing protein [Acetatifactor sp.]